MFHRKISMHIVFSYQISEAVIIRNKLKVSQCSWYENNFPRDTIKQNLTFISMKI